MCASGLEFGTTVPASIRAQLWHKYVAPVKQEDATCGVQWMYPCTQAIHLIHIISDSNENISQSIHFLVMSNERAIFMDVLFENILLQWIILECVV